MKIDLRSDTLTQPTPEMRQAMMEAEVGDDIYGEDPTINRLQEKAAALMGKEAALFVPTGSMGNLVSLMSHCQPGTEVICEAKSHVANFEMGSMSLVAGLFPRMIMGTRGCMDPEDIVKAINPKIYYMSPTGIICLENSANIAGGGVLDLEYMAHVRTIADEHGLPVHLDGARIFNAAVALGVDVHEIAAFADSVMFCLSKGLCAPVGSLVAGSSEFIEKAHVNRKRVGGAMRQVGVLGAAGIVALDTIPPLLHHDHEKIEKIVQFLSKHSFIEYDPKTVKTNILMFSVDHPQRTAADLQRYLEEQGVLCHCVGESIRLVTYQDLSFEMIDRALEIMEDIFAKRF